MAVAPASASADCAITMTLRQGSTGAEVMCLQSIVGASADGKFGPMTLASVMAWQSGHGLVADGVVGPLTRAAMMGSAQLPAGCQAGWAVNPFTGASCTTQLPAGCQAGWAVNPFTGASCTGGTPPDNGDLQGGAGSANYSLMSEFASEQVGEDEEDVEVAGLEIEAEDSDLELTAVRLVFVQGTAGSDFEDYAAEVSVWLDGEEIGRVDGDKFNDGNTYTSTITLDGGVIDEGDKGELVVAVSGVTNLDTNDAGDTWTVDFRSVRYSDALGDSTSEDPATATKTFSFESFATAADSRLDMRITTGTEADKINKAHLINSHLTDENELKGISLLEFTMEAEGDSDLEIRDFGVDLVVTGAADVDDIIAGGTVATTGGSPEVFLEIEGQRYGTAGYNEAAADNREIAWTDVDYIIKAGDTVTAKIVANFNALDTDADDADTILAQLTETQSDDTALFDVRDESGTQILDADIVGAPTGVASTLRDTGFGLEFVSASATRSHTGDVANTLDHDQGTFVIVFNLEAWDDNATSIFLDESTPMEDDGTTSITVTVQGTDTYVTSSVDRTGGDSSNDLSNTREILAGDEVEFTVTYVTAAGADGLFRTTLENIAYALTNVDGTLTVSDTEIELTDSFKTPELSLNFDD
ncbi:MAG: Cell wall-associated hydrolase, invasion-associated protein [Candidatus Nomurabacteria bacterium GW2011_GWB1_47_6]|uniref:Cell wall-associated hydrolase, invasion-associated protein n=1 Tax=Candidatus Nomurabacteria bacterium GW2011_GWB1_47_6 TaxID=1618749 RepID=A0A0G1T225_9BACT|nr:MAG: Cell wall-associated hydrolase, invasion-associated protein [Candidatus Nomurabacteria bacterium GW2011_GWB1_47_6]